MPRLSPAPFEQYEPLFGAAAHPRQQIYAHRPEIARKHAEFGRTLRQERILPSRLVELVRLRVAFWNQCRSCMAARYEEAIDDGVTEALVCSLERPEEADDLSEAEKAALRYADLMATDHLAVDDAVFDRLRACFTEPEIVELGVHLAVFVGFGRLSATWDLVDDLPDRYADRSGVVTPWGSVCRLSA